MSQPTTTGPSGPKGPAGRSAGAQARAARAAAARAERERKARAAKMRNLAISIAVVVVLAIAAVIVIPRLHSSSSSTTAATPAGLTTYTKIKGTTVKASVEGPATAPVTIVLFEDFQCPYCEQLEKSAGAEFTSLAQQGKIRILYSMISFLDTNSKNKYSSRAASAYYCAPQSDRKAFHTYLYDHQPAEATAGPTDAQLITEAKAAGVPATSSFSQCVNADRYAGFATGPQTNSLAAVTSVGTPTMFVNGQLFPGAQGLTPATLDQVVAQASSS